MQEIQPYVVRKLRLSPGSTLLKFCVNTGVLTLLNAIKRFAISLRSVLFFTNAIFNSQCTFIYNLLLPSFVKNKNV